MKKVTDLFEGKIWTYGDIEQLDNSDVDQRYEIINGVLHKLSAPSIMHQALSSAISKKIGVYLEGKPCEVYTAPTNVYLDKRYKDSKKYVQPDIFVLCNKNKLKENGVYGAPDLIVEIISKGYERKDRIEKLNLYLDNKVKEYWIIDPIGKTIEVHLLTKNKYNLYKITDKVKVNIFDDLFIDISKEYLDKEYLLKEEDVEYGPEHLITEKLREYLEEYFDSDFKIGEYEAILLNIILSIREEWNYGELLKLGGFKKCFEIINGQLIYKPD